MCTVTFISKSNSDFILTSNRDEAPGRETFPPKIYEEEGVQLLYPKDAVAGGTWIGISERKRAISLMNGGFVPHTRKPNYRRSRGLVLKDFLISEDLESELKAYDFSKIEPFTAVVVEWIKEIELYAVVWDGEKLHIIKEPLLSKIWSSSPLYPKNIKSKREEWFSEYFIGKENVLGEEILQFHKTAGEGNPETNLIMDRGFVQTKSITQIIKRGQTIEMYYEDLQTGKVFNSDFSK